MERDLKGSDEYIMWICPHNHVTGYPMKYEGKLYCNSTIGEELRICALPVSRYRNYDDNPPS